MQLRFEPKTKELTEVVLLDKGRHRSYRAVLHVIVGKLLITTITIGTGVITARILKSDGRGEQTAICLWPTLLVWATTLGLPTSLVFHLNRSRENQDALISAAFLICACSTVVIGLAAFVVLPVLLNHYSHYVIVWAQTLLASLPIGVFVLLGRAIFEANGEFTLSMRSQWLFPVITFVVLLLLVAADAVTPLTTSLAYTLNGIPVAAWMFVRLRSNLRFQFEGVFYQARRLLIYGLPACGIDLCGTLSANIDQAMVLSLLSPAALGVYGVTLSATRALSFCQQAVTMVLFPKAAACDPDLVASLTVRAARATLLVSAIFAFLLAAVSPFLIHRLYGPNFHEAIGPFRLLLMEATIGATTIVLAQAAMALGKPTIVTFLQLCGLVLTIPLLLVFVPRWGLMGAALSVFISTVFRLILMLLAFPLLLNRPLPRLWMTSVEILRLSKDLRSTFLPFRS